VTRGGALDYRATTAQWHAERAARHPKPAKLALNAMLRAYVQNRLAGIVVAPSGAAVLGPRCSGKVADRTSQGATLGICLAPVE
jgi:hypothetical protein